MDEGKAYEQGVEDAEKKFKDKVCELKRKICEHNWEKFGSYMCETLYKIRKEKGYESDDKLFEIEKCHNCISIDEVFGEVDSECAKNVKK